MTTGILQLQTERLILQPLQDSSASELYKLMTDYDTAERAGFRPLNDESEAEGKVYGNGNSSTAFGIHPKGDENQLLGIIEYMVDEHTSISRPLKEVTIAYYLEKSHRKQGYMTEALHCLMNYLFGFLECDHMQIYTYPRNEASKRVAIKCGFKYIRTEKAACRSGLGVIEDLEFYTITKEEFKQQGKMADIQVSCITPGRKLSDESETVPKLTRFIENGKQGLKNQEGAVVFPAEFDKIAQWSDCDVIETFKDGVYRYYNTAGDEILTDIDQLEMNDDGFKPYYIEEAQSRPELITFTAVDSANDTRCCLMHGHWVRLGRILRKDVKRWLSGKEIIPFGANAFDDFRSQFTYIYSAYEATASGADANVKCVERLRQIGCFDSSWAYLTRVSIHPENEVVSKDIRSLVLPLESYASNDMHRIAIGTDISLARDEVKIRMVRYFKDRWPLDEEIGYKDVIMNGSLQEMCAHRNRVLNLINDLSRQEVRSDAVRDFLAVWEKVPDEMYRSTPQQAREEKARTLFSFTGRDPKYIWTMIAAVAEDLVYAVPDENGQIILEELCEKASTFLKWLLKEGFDVNYVHNLKTPLDLIQSVRRKAEAEKRFGEFDCIQALEKIEQTLLESGARNLQNYFIEPETLMDRIYPFMKRI